MRKEIAMVLIFAILSSISFSQSLDIYRRINNAWIKETNPNIASVEGLNAWTSGNIVLNDWYTLPKIYVNTQISQWMFISIQYLNYYIHVNMPGDYITDSLTIQVETNGGVYAYFQTGGWLGGIIPTWIGYKIDDSTPPSYGLPSSNSNNNFWYDMKWINDNVGNASQKITIGGPSAWTHTFYGWVGFRVDKSIPKGQYSTYVDIYIQSDP